MILLVLLVYGCAVSSSSGVTTGDSPVPSSLPSGPVRWSEFATSAQVRLAVRAGLGITRLGSTAQPSLQLLAQRQEYGNNEATGCKGTTTYEASLPVLQCTFGVPSSAKVMVLEGDSRAQMWFDTVNAIAKATGYRLVFLSKGGCPSADGSFRLNDGRWENAPWPACTAWHRFVVDTVRSLHPAVVITASQLMLYAAGTTAPLPPESAAADFAAFYHEISGPWHLVVIGGFPEPLALNPTLCLSQYPTDVERCTWVVPRWVDTGVAAVRSAAVSSGALYIDQRPWLCAGNRCPAVVAGIIPYTIDGYHIDRVYAKYLTGVLWSALAPVIGR
ncbi:MAG TPA: SGNH hydrolase domain-containing protein [Acidimicrobiales bacterium]|nr:SGNH hydrolase domain-containing protein [Acidimicrobiales bacterium]